MKALKLTKVISVILMVCLVVTGLYVLTSCKVAVADEQTQTDTANSGDGQASDQTDQTQTQETADTTTEQTEETTEEATAPTGVKPLHVKGTKLVDEDGKTVILQGPSLHGISFTFWNSKGKETKATDYISKAAFKTLKKDWHANTIRVPVYTEDYMGYCNGGSDNQKKMLKSVYKAVDCATELDMYVIIDWHILSDGNPNNHKKEAKTFFKKMAKKYADHDNVIYEICNEPNGGVNWKDHIKPYAKTIVSTIRKYDDDAIIVVGTGTWSQDVDQVIGNKLSDKNVMYSLHFYASTHGEWLIDRAQKAINKGVPIFITECSICEASGNGSINKTMANKWMKFIRKNYIPFICWNLSNKNEASSLIKESCTKKSGWTTKQLSATGKWFRTKMRKK